MFTGTEVEALYTLNASITKNNWSTIAAYTGVVGSNSVCRIPGEYLLVGNPTPIGRSLYYKMYGTIQNTAAATFANAINLNPTAGTSTGNIAINTAYTPTASVTAVFTVEAWLTCTAYTTSTHTWQINGTVVYGTVASGGAVSTATSRADFDGTFAGLDPRVTQYLELFGTWSAANAANQTIVKQAFLIGLT